MANNRVTVKVNPKVDESKGNYTKVFRKGQVLYQFDDVPGTWNGPNRKQEFDPETFLPIKKGTPVVEPQPERKLTRGERNVELQTIPWGELRSMAGLTREDRGLTKPDVIKQILDNEGYPVE